MPASGPRIGAESASFQRMTACAVSAARPASTTAAGAG